MKLRRGNLLEELDQTQWSQKLKVYLGVVTADCVPILIYNYDNQMVGCVHAGWKGALSGIIQKQCQKCESKSQKI